MRHAAQHRQVGRRFSLSLLAVVSVLIASACGSSSSSSPASQQIVVAAASDLRPAFEDLAWQFTEDTGIDVVFTFGSSGQLREQIINGAPFDVFASANAQFVDDVISADRAVAESKTNYAIGRIVLWSADPNTLPQDITALQSSQYARIAIANPTHAPYGIAAQQALKSAGIYDAVKNKLVFGENISDTKQIIDSGNASIGIIALSLVIADGGEYVVIPEGLHEPLVQATVITATETRVPMAQKWIDYMSSSKGLGIMARYGFVRP